MPKFSQSSQAKLNTCHPDLIHLFSEVIKHYDCTVITGHRGEKEQTEAFETGHSRTPWPRSKHNSMPSQAVDVAPYPINWSDVKRFYHFAGFVTATAKMMGIKIRSGLDWDRDNDLSEETFIDGPHFELVD